MKTILISILAALVIAAIGVSAYNVLAGTQTQEAAAAHNLSQTTLQRNMPGSVADPSISGAASAEVVPGASASNEPSLAGDLAAQESPASAAWNGQGGGQGKGMRRGQSDTQSASGIPQPQNGMNELLNFSGVVSGYVAPQFTLLTPDGQSILVQLGSLNQINALGLTLQDGDSVTLSGFLDQNGALAVAEITIQSTGQTYTLRDGTGRPTWAGGPNK